MKWKREAIVFGYFENENEVAREGIVNENSTFSYKEKRVLKRDGILRLNIDGEDMRRLEESERVFGYLLTREVVVCDFACTEFAGRDLVRKRSRRENLGG